MTFDRRWPQLERIDRLPVATRNRVVEVCERAFVSALWNPVIGEIHFYLGEPNSGVWQQKVEPNRPWSSGTVDYVTKVIQRARMSARQKDRLIRNAKTSEASDIREQRGRDAEDKVHYYEDILRKSRNRRDMGNHFKGSSVVSGLKGVS